MEVTGTLWVKGPDKNWYLKCDEAYIPLDMEAINKSQRFGWEPRPDMNGLVASGTVEGDKVIDISIMAI